MKSTQPHVRSAAIAFSIVVFVLAHCAQAKVVNIGGSGGYLYYPNAQTTLGLAPGDTVYIVAGTYTGLSIGNVTGTAEAPITVKCAPNAVFTTTGAVGNSWANLAFVRFEDFRFESYASRGVGISGRSHDLLFKNFRFINIGDWVFRIYDSTMVFDGTKASTFYNFKWEDVLVDGCNGGVIINSDWASVSNMISMCLDFEVVRCTILNSNGTNIELSKCFNLKVHECTFDNMGSTNHNAMIGLLGYGQIYNNTFSRAWGDDVRAFPMKLNTLGYNGSDAVIRFYNNISYEKKKYPMFEQNGVGQADLDASGGLLSRTASEIYFNTLYRSRKGDYIGTLVDSLWGNLTIRHNLIIEPECDAAFNASRNYVYQITGSLGGQGLVSNNNLVYSTFAASGLVDAVTFLPSATSPAKDASNAGVSYITEDRYGNLRSVGTADVGAVERQILGDFSGDGLVDQADYTTWADNYGQADTALAPGSRSTSNSGPINQADYTTWADNYGHSAPPAPMMVEEPASPAEQ